MQFTRIGESATVELDMEDLELLARACHVSAVQCGEGGAATEAMGTAFTLAACIARTAGDINDREVTRMQGILERVRRADGE